MYDQNKRIVITGGPGAGKSTLLELINSKGYMSSAEAGRAIIQDQVAIGGNALPWANRLAFAELMLNWELRSWHEANGSPEPFFFDRGIPDVAGYLALCNLLVPAHIERAIELYRYAPKVFIAPPWEEIFVQDAERKQSFSEAIATYHAMVESYNKYGYQLIELPFATVEERAEFVFSSL